MLNQNKDIHMQETQQKKCHIPQITDTDTKSSSLSKTVNMDISFEQLQYQVQIKEYNKEKKKMETINKIILDNINGIFKNGEITAIMGSSGAGKTSLLNLLCKRIQKNKQNSIKGKIKVNNHEYNFNEFSKFASYVMQDDRLMATLTVREVLLFAAKLKVGGTFKDQNNRVDFVIKQLGLEKCQNTYIGDKDLKGVSGGERKRTSIAFEIIANPQVLILDEPTSGLDSFTAFLVINCLKKLAKEENKTIIFTIHQPSSDIWALFDRIMLLVNGKFIYQGPGNQEILNYFKEMGFNCPRYSNPADYLISLMHKESYINCQNFTKYFNNYENKQQQIIQQQIESKEQTPVYFTQVTQNSNCKEIQILFNRTYKNMVRNKLLFKTRLVQSLFVACFASMLFYQLDNGKDDPDNFRKQTDYTGFFFFQCMNMAVSNCIPVVLTFPSERAVFLKEENSNFYSVGSYFIGRTLLEFPFLLLFPTLQSTIQYFGVGLTLTFEIYFKYLLCNILLAFVGNSLGVFLGCIFSDPKNASGVVPSVILPFMVISGFFQNRENLSPIISWIEYISPFKYGFDSQVSMYFKDTYFRPNPIDVLNLEIGYWEGCVILFIMFFVLRILAFTFLFIFKKKLQ